MISEQLVDTADTMMPEGSTKPTASIDDEIRSLEESFRVGTGEVIPKSAPSDIGALTESLARDHPDMKSGVTDLEYVGPVSKEDKSNPEEVAKLKRDIEDVIDRRGARTDPYYRGVLKIIDQKLDRAVESGYPLDYIYKSVDSVFGPYAMNGVEGPLDEWYKQIMSSEFDAMGIVSGASLDLMKMTQGDNPDYDYVMLNIARRLRKGEVYDAKDVRSNLEAMTSTLQQLYKNDPEVYEALRRTDMNHSDDASMIGSYVNLGERLAPDLPFLMEKTGMSMDQLLRLLGDQYRKMDTDTGQFSEGIYKSVEDYKYVVNSGLNFDTEVLADVFFSGNLDSGHSTQIRNFLTSDIFKKLMTDERMTEYVNRALGLMSFNIGKFDLDSDIKILQSVDRAPKEYLQHLIIADSGLGKDAKQTFYELAPNILSRRDKDGNLYDSPQILANAISEHTGEPSKDVEFAWYVESGIPVAALDTVVHFRKEALDAGIDDTPRAVYEWVYKDPNKVLELSHQYLTDYVTRLNPVMDAETIAVMVEKANRLADSMSEDFRIFVNISPSSLQHVVDSGGAIRSTFDASVGKKGVYDNNYMQVRSGVEIALGIRSLDGNEEHPVYGTASYVGNGVPLGAVGYGEIAISYKFDEGLESRTSFTPEDSFHGAHRLTARDAQILRIIKTGMGLEDQSTKEYIEAQVGGGLKTDDIDAIYVSSQAMVDELPDSLRAKAVIRETRTDFTDRPYKGAREHRLYEDVKNRDSPTDREGI